MTIVLLSAATRRRLPAQAGAGRSSFAGSGEPAKSGGGAAAFAAPSPADLTGDAA